ncbi:uncharacterized protein UV8b_07791 [Ustilaginoidea virens]|uniref:Amidohydrolase 3 domain-containing protein n=2 Tax=Ustilaginoidea virens TaxID=1159556 RepID=A0A8E5HY64_USTVR|nr:uncharacterized protein UV8b_07791 [Ustilaginoidea virens]QUC23550.1 hypothetical protein UV8b_07791 [Ustilaginoidea virens]
MDGKSGLPPYSPPDLAVARAGTAESRQPLGNHPNRLRSPRGIRRSRGTKFFVLACLALIVLAQWKHVFGSRRSASSARLSLDRLNQDLATCKRLRRKPQDPIGLGRGTNARFVHGARPTLIKNATIWAGEPAEGTSDAEARAGKGWQWTRGDVYLEHGLISKVGQDLPLHSLPQDTQLFDAEGRLLTSGIIDMHSHAGVDSLPALRGTSDFNEFSDNVTPYVRSIDGLYVFDPQIQVIKSGGVTTSLILPGSSNNIGGEAYLIKHAVGRPDGRNETSANDLLADPERHWRYMKMACGENPKRATVVPGRYTSRLGESFAFRHAFEEARDYVRKQDDWCDKATALGVESMGGYLPQEIKWELLGAALRGQVHINVHCYTVPDLEAMVDHTQEFEFPVRTFHHAHQAFLVPEILKRTWGGRAPASALFADNMFYKMEAYVGSESAGKHLYEAGLTPVYVSDNPVLNGQHVLFEAAKAYHYGLPYHAALASVTTAPAEELGMGKRLGKVKPGYDADIVVWDSDPLSVGATPVQVWIDGHAQYTAPVYHDKPVEGPIGPDAAAAPAGVASEPIQVADVVFKGVSKVLLSDDAKYEIRDEPANVVVSKGRISCIGTCHAEVVAAAAQGGQVLELKNGYVTHSFTGVSGTLGLNEIDAEESTDNGNNVDKFTRAADGLLLDSKKLRVGAQHGVTRAISAPKFNALNTHHGTSVGFVTTARTSLDKGAVFAADVAVHYTLSAQARAASKSYTEAFGALRRKLLRAARANETEPEPEPYSEEAYLKRVVSGAMALALTINSADGIASALRIKAEVEGLAAARINMAIVGGAEAHLVADQLAAASVGVILSGYQPMPVSWDSRRALSGAPLTNGTAADWLVTAGATVAIGLAEDWCVRDLGFEAGTAYRNGDGRFTERSALDLVSTNIYKILGVRVPRAEDAGHFLVSEGSPLRIGSRIRAVGSGRGAVSVFV